MRDTTKLQRQAQIEAAAYAVLEEKGYAGASMLAIARKARASNETLYNWYGDKNGLFAALVRGNAAASRDFLEKRVAQGGNALETLEKLGPELLEMLTGDRAIALNRAAAADPTGALGTVLAEEGRQRIAPLVAQVIDQARDQGLLQCEDRPRLAETYLNLLIGDIQIRRATGQIAKPEAKDLQERSARALADLQKLFAPKD